MTRREVLQRFISERSVLDRYWPMIADHRVDRRSQPPEYHEEHAAFARAERAGDVALHDDDDGDTYATLTTQGRSKVDRIIERQP